VQVIAFLTSGRSPFDREKIKEYIIWMPLESKIEGRLLYWINRQKNRRCLVSVDTASGRGVENLDQADAKEAGTDCDVIQVCFSRLMCTRDGDHQRTARISARIATSKTTGQPILDRDTPTDCTTY
jgi:hypothetical protein